MSASLNKVCLIGRLGKDPELKDYNGTKVAKISLATSEYVKDKPDYTEWHNVTFFGKVAEVVGQYTSKGSLIYLEGRLRKDKWTDKNGNNCHATNIIANSVQLLSGKNDAQLPLERPAVDPFANEDIPF